MEIAEETVLKIAALAKIDLTPAECSRLSREMGRIVAFADQLAELDLEDVPPTTHAVQMENVFREDRVIPPCPREEILAGAPERDESCFVAPRVLD